MDFWKMNGAGNDFIVLNNMDGQIPEEAFPQMARVLCERHLSIGADGFMAVGKPREGGDYRMIFLNADGSYGEMCGNGARCICRYGYEHGLAGETQRVETMAGLVTGQRVNERLYKVRLNDPSVIRLDYLVEESGKTYACSYVELGNPGLPHAVVSFTGLADTDMDELRKLGRALRWNSAFPKGANVNFCEITGENEVCVRTFERGVEDFTYACGTGSGSTAVSLFLQGKVSSHGVKINMPGGQLIIDIEHEGEQIRDLYLTGPTNIVCKGEITDEDLNL